MEAIYTLAALLAALGVIYRAIAVPLRRLVERSNQFFDDWHGVPARPGFPARPGVMERLERLEAHSETAAAQLTSNGGSSVKDGLDRVEQALGTKPA